MNLLLVFALFAQTLSAQPAYTTADPVNPDRLGLATYAGRYMIELGEGCGGIEAGQNVEVSLTDGMTLLNGICQVVNYQRMADTPCFQNAGGACDVAAETD